MPKNKEALIRYRIIDSCLRNKYHPYPSMERLREVMEEKLGKEFSVSTIQKDIKAMREDNALGYLAPIRYSKAHDGYYYEDPNYTIASIPLNEHDIKSIWFAAAVLEQFRDITIFRQYSNAVDKIMEAVNLSRVLEEGSEPVIRFEQVPYQKGREWIGPLLEAIQQRKTVQFQYKRFDRDIPKLHTVHPYLLKEYRNRWYLVGMHDRREVILTYGLDRISLLEEAEIPWRSHAGFEPEEYFRYAIGITTYDGDPVDIVLSFTPIQGEYLKTQPLHHTQEILEDNQEVFKVTIRVYPTVELRMLILGYGPSVKVESPDWFAREIRKTLEKTLTRYKDL